MSLVSVQQRLYPESTCFGCGLANARGLRLQSFVDGEGVRATFTPWAEHDNGVGFLNGGIISTVLDCHSGAAAFHEANMRGWPPAPGAPYPYVTAGLTVAFLRPAPLHAACELRARVTDADEDQMLVEAELLWEGKQRAIATSHWKRWRPRR